MRCTIEGELRALLYAEAACYVTHSITTHFACCRQTRDVSYAVLIISAPITQLIAINIVLSFMAALIGGEKV